MKIEPIYKIAFTDDDPEDEDSWAWWDVSKIYHSEPEAEFAKETLARKGQEMGAGYAFKLIKFVEEKE